MIKSLGVSYAIAELILKHYTVHMVLTGQIDKDTCFNMTYDTKFKVGTRGYKLYNASINLKNNRDMQCKILSCINGITADTANKILDVVQFDNIINNTFADNTIADVKKNEKRKIGQAMETNIRNAFAVKLDTEAQEIIIEV